MCYFIFRCIRFYMMCVLNFKRSELLFLKTFGNEKLSYWDTVRISPFGKTDFNKDGTMKII